MTDKANETVQTAHGEAAPEATTEAGQDPAGGATLQQELEQARQEAAANYDKFLRARADMENYKRRVERTYTDLARNSKKDLLKRLLGVKDNLERALHFGESDNGSGESLMEGVRLTAYQLDQLLEAEGVRPIAAEGKPFDPHIEEAVHTVDDPNVPDHTVVEVYRKGYTYGADHEVLRPAQVIVSVHGGEDKGE